MKNILNKGISLKTVSPLKLQESMLVETEEGFLVVDKNLKVVAVNSAYRKFHNLFNSFDIVPGKDLNESDFSSFPESFYCILNNVLAGETENSLLQVEYMGDNVLSFAISVVRVNEEGRNLDGACVMVHKKEIQSSMTKSNQDTEFFKLLVDTSTSVYLLADAALVFTYASNAVEVILGISPQEMLGKNAIELVHPDDREEVRDWLIEVRMHPGKLVTHEYRVKNKQGEYLWIENNARNMLNNSNIKAIVMNFRNIQAKKVADHALVRTEQRLSLLLNNTEESFIILNSRLRIVTYNKAAQDRSPFFYNTELQSGLSVLDLIKEEEVSDYIDLFEEVFKGREIEKESTFVDPLAIAHIYSHTFRPLFDHQNDIFGVFITSTEITERKKLTEAVAVNSERLKTAQKIARLGYFEYDVTSKTIFCSEEFYEILELTDTLQNWWELSAIEQIVHPDDMDVLKSEIEKSLLFGNDFNLEFRLVIKDRNEKVINAIGGSEKNDAGQIVKFRVTLQDITDSKMAILALQTLESKFKSLFEHSIDGVILSNQPGLIISANPAVCTLLDYSHDEITSLSACELLDIHSPAFSKMMEIRKIENGAFMGEIHLKHKSGHYIPVEITSITMTDGNGNPYLSTIIRDITEKKKIEKEQNALTEELLKNNQDLQQFSFITSHNLRAPVANLLSLLSLYNKQNPADEFNGLLIEKFEEATLQLNQTLNDLVNILVIKSNNNIERETISFSDIFTDVKRTIDNLLKQKNGTIEVDFLKVDEIQYNRIHLESIFLNMISNAIRYSSPDRQLEIKIRSYRTENWVVVDFSDNGLGMDLKRYGDRLFGLYQRFHNNKEGKGLGLYMTRSQVTAMGGKIEVESEPGKGTSFKIYFKS